MRAWCDRFRARTLGANLGFMVKGVGMPEIGPVKGSVTDRVNLQR